MNFKKFLVVLLGATLLLGGCSSDAGTSENSKKEKEETTSSEPLTKDEFTKMFSNPKKYKGKTVDFYAKVFVEPEKDDDGTYLQVYAENNEDKNAIVGIDDPNLSVNNDDIIHIIGKVTDEYEGENLMGGTVVAPVIKATKIELSDYATAFAPAIKKVDVNKEIDQHGYKIKVQKFEKAEKESRIYLSITNTTKDEISFYSYDSKIVLNGKQYEENDELSWNYPEIQSEILPGVTTEGVIVFDALPDTGTFKLLLEGSSDNYDLDFKPFEFEIKY